MRTERLNMRVTAEEHELLRRAAEASGQTITQYVLSRVIADAHDDLTDRSLFPVDGPAWTEFRARLDRPAEFNPALDKLLTRKSPWDEAQDSPGGPHPPPEPSPVSGIQRAVEDVVEQLRAALAELDRKVEDVASMTRPRTPDTPR